MKINNSVKLFLNLTKIQSEINRKFDSGLGGISLSEFMILWHLDNTKDGKLRRVELAEKVGLTQSGITRLLLPMEKIGLVKKEADKNDARASFVKIATGGKTKLSEGVERAELISEEILSEKSIKRVNDLSDLILDLGGTFK